MTPNAGLIMGVAMDVSTDKSPVKGREIASRRDALGYTQVGLVGNSDGFSLATLQRAEAGDPTLGYATVRAIATALNCSIEDIYDEEVARARDASRPVRERQPDWAKRLESKVDALIAFHRSGGNADRLENT